MCRVQHGQYRDDEVCPLRQGLDSELRVNMFRWLVTYLRAKTPLALYCRVVNARNCVSGRAHRIAPFEGNSILKAWDGADELFLCRRRRHRLYKRGIRARIERLVQDYHLDHVPAGPGGLLIDCGANVGELGLWARTKGMDYVAFEPEALEARCIDLNVYDGEPKTIRKALWNRNTTLEFFSKPETADGSVIDPGGTEARFAVDAVRLDTVMDLADRPGPVILKVEAEGAEPEILEGAESLLSAIDFVTVDCGPERGHEEAHTLVETNNLLLDAGFRIRQFGARRMTGLYVNANR